MYFTNKDEARNCGLCYLMLWSLIGISFVVEAGKYPNRILRFLDYKIKRIREFVNF